jgi:outer membrane protein TolC
MTGRHTVGLVLCALGAACAAETYSADADREVGAVLAGTEEAVDADRRAELVQPADVPADPPPPPPVPRDDVEGDPGVLASLPRNADGALQVDLERSLQLAVSYNRSFKTRRESLYRTGLGYTLTRFDFGPQLNWAFSTLYGDTENLPRTHGIASRFGVSQILPTGGSASFDAAATTDYLEGSGRVYGSSVGISLTQPLLRGLGYEVSHEPLTQAERDLVYSVRDWELFRQEFSIETASSYYAILSQRKTLANEEANYRQAVFDRQKAEALYATDRQSEQEVFRARRRELQAENTLVDARADFDRALEQFKITLGIPTETPIELADQPAVLEPIDIDPQHAFEAARVNRLDLLTERERMDDAERSLRIARNGLLPDLDLEAGYRFVGADDDPGDAGPDLWAASIGLTLEIPLQRKAERNRYRDAEIALSQARREYRNSLDQLEVDVGDQVRRLKSIERQAELQRSLIEQEQRAVAVSEIRFEAGDLDNRDLLEARQALIDAQNALIRLEVDHFIGRLRLLRTLGLLFVDAEGMWL